MRHHTSMKWEPLHIFVSTSMFPCCAKTLNSFILAKFKIPIPINLILQATGSANNLEVNYLDRKSQYVPAYIYYRTIIYQ